jgi:transcriptional regulator with XRE-family HTH domain
MLVAMTQDLAKRILDRRLELGLSQNDIARALGITNKAVSHWETGRSQNIKLEHLVDLADVLRVDLRWLAVGKGDPAPQKPVEPSLKEWLELGRSLSQAERNAAQVLFRKR